ncbi:CDP-diacylglycerol--glycerol-3-phosphate 3-phosphatidyltransferase, partial [Paracoccaceae bacterium]|nr:CDP-diacylglycerol--glycerol-3-phosphate 3-phosphatidyltransferase [Paracoccaceae bacterium]
DKAMVIIALLIIVGYSSMSPWLVLPATVILFREVFVSGLREFLGDSASTLQVTKLAKWKTTAQMAAIAILFSQGVFEHYLKLSAREIGPDALNSILNGAAQDTLGVIWKYHAMIWSGNVGLILLWVAAALTLITGFDYFKKALPFLKDEA